MTDLKPTNDQCCPACSGSGHKDDASITAEDIKFLEWTKQHRPCHFRYYEDLQRRDAKKAAKQASQVPDEA